MGSRISAKEAAWLIDRGTTAPWAAIPLDAQLKDADPRATDGLYDRAAALWEHFWDARPVNVSTAKISKTLYLMRPGLFPILDSYLTVFYRTAARAAAIDVGQQRPSLALFRTLYWEAVRRDIVGNEAALRALRRVLPATGAPLAQQATERLSDLRLLDMLAFAASPGASTGTRPLGASAGTVDRAGAGDPGGEHNGDKREQDDDRDDGVDFGQLLAEADRTENP
jgi:hypothetical protein